MTTKRKSIKQNLSGGFTLLEMLIALSLVSVVAVIVAGALQLGVRAWERSETVVESLQRTRVVLNRLQHQLRAATYPAGENNDASKTAFAGEPHAVEYIAALAMDPSHQYGWVHVRYTVEVGPDGRNRLLLFEQNLQWSDGGPDASPAAQSGHSGYVELLGGFDDLHFEFLTATTGGDTLDWRPTWRPEGKIRLPKAIRITYQEANGQPIRAIARTEAGT